MAIMVRFKSFLCTTIVIVWTLTGQASAAEPLRLIVDRLPLYEDLSDDKALGFSVEVVRQVFAAMGQDASIEFFPWARGWSMVSRGERDGIFSALRTTERDRVCSFPDEPLKQQRYVFFVRVADKEKLHFSSFDDLVGHDVAVHGPAPGLFEEPIVSRELWKFLREHDNMVETYGGAESLRMLAAGRVDYAVANLSVGMVEIAAMGLTGKIEPILSYSVIEGGFYVCFSKARVSPALVDAFSRALKQFKQTDAFQLIDRKYFP